MNRFRIVEATLNAELAKPYAYGTADCFFMGCAMTRSHIELGAAARAGVETLKAAAVDARTAFVDSFLPSGSLWGRSAVDQQFLPFKGALEDFRKSARAGAPDFAGLRAEVERLVSTDPSGLRKAGDAIIPARSTGSLQRGRERRMISRAG